MLSLTLELERDRDAPARARTMIRGLKPLLGAERTEDATLLVSELVTNAVRHAGGAVVRLVVALEGRALRIEVHDPGQGFELKPPPDDPLRASGWGLVLVEELADRWGIDHDPRTRVWFEMD
jgi:anti-sigma regulatory factor (Ser/Thr protein kinase)